MLEGTVHFQTLVPYKLPELLMDLRWAQWPPLVQEHTRFFTTPQLQTVQVNLAAGRCEKEGLNGCRNY